MTWGHRYKKSDIYKSYIPMFVLHPASFKEFGSLMCLWQACKLWKMQLVVRSLNVTWRRDLWGHEVIFFWKCVKLVAEQLWQIWQRFASPFFRYLRKKLREGEGVDSRPPAVRGFNQALLYVIRIALTRETNWCQLYVSLYLVPIKSYD